MAGAHDDERNGDGDDGPTDAEVERALTLLRAHALALPETTERLSHGSPSFFIRDKKQFATFVDDHHGDGILGFWAAAPDGVQAQLVETEPERFYRPAYVGHRGWIGVRLDIDLDEDEIGKIVLDAYRCIAPKSLLARVDEAT
ncbi:MAG: MmcQ/YjbR family DNA-binding protein [Acidimicrobiales bacterium]